MSFLAPLFLLGGIAVALPIIFHLIRRASRERMTFSSLMFLQPTPPRVTRRSRLENIFLLLLRCLVLCLLALAFARPFFSRPMPAAPEEGSGQRTIVLVDSSASMRRDGLWPAALDIAREVLNGIPPADQASVFTFSQQARPLVTFDQWTSMNAGERAALTVQQLAESKPGWASTHLGNALITAVETLMDADTREDHPRPSRVILITDLQEGSRLEGLQGYEWPRAISVEVRPVRTRRPTNAGLQWIVDADDYGAGADDTGPRVRISNSSDAGREQFQIHWDGVGDARPMDVYIPPGQSRIVPAPLLPDGVRGERLVLSGDDDDFDNAVNLMRPEPERIVVVFLGDDPEQDPARLLYYLKRAFQQTRRRAVRVDARPSAALLTDPELADARLVVFSDVLSAGRLEAVRKSILDGGTVLCAMTHAAVAPTLARLCDLDVDALVAAEAPSDRYAMLGQIDFEHPLFAPFADPRFSDFTKIHFWKHRRLETGNIPAARVLARFDNGDAALVEIPRGKGRLFVLTAGWHRADSQLALSSKFVPLLYALIESSGNAGAYHVQYRVGDEVNLASLNADGPLSVRKPDGSTAELPADVTTFTQTDQPGVYAIPETQPPVRFAVNLDGAESRTGPMPVEELMRLGVPLAPDLAVSAKKAAQQRQLHAAELESRQKLWHRLIVAALVILMLETWLAGWLTRRTAIPAAT